MKIEVINDLFGDVMGDVEVLEIKPFFLINLMDYPAKWIITFVIYILHYKPLYLRICL